MLKPAAAFAARLLTIVPVAIAPVQAQTCDQLDFVYINGQCVDLNNPSSSSSPLHNNQGPLDISDIYVRSRYPSSSYLTVAATITNRGDQPIVLRNPSFNLLTLKEGTSSDWQVVYSDEFRMRRTLKPGESVRLRRTVFKREIATRHYSHLRLQILFD